MLQASTSVMIPELMKAFSIDVVGVGFISASFFYPYLILQIPAGLLVDRIGPRKLLSIAIPICALACFIFAKANNMAVAESSRLLMGMVSAPGVVAALYLAATWFPVKKFALLVGLTEMLGVLGGAIGEQVLGHMVTGVGWRESMVACGVVGLVLAILAWLFVRDRPQIIKEPIDVVYETTGVWQRLRSVISIPQAWIVGLYAGFMFALIPAFAALWSVPLIEDIYKAPLHTAASASSMIFIGAALGTPLAGWISDRIGRRKPVMYTGAVLSFITFVCILYTSAIPLNLMFVLLFLLGLFSSSYVISFAIMREITQPDNHGTAMGYANMMCVIVGAPILQPLIGLFLRYGWSGKVINGVAIYSAGDYQRALTALTVCLALAIVNVFFVKETYCQQSA